jgi:hypothetical protein
MKSSNQITLDKKLEKFDSRGIQTLFRNLSRNHYNLLKMVDNKAGIIITMNSVIISLLMGVLYIGTNTGKSNFEVSQIRFFIGSCVLSMTIAVISMLPYRYMGKRFRNSTYKGTLYAQNFSQMTLDEFRSNIYNAMDSGFNLYDEMINDLYFLGQFITYKQRLVLVSFLVFLIGMLGAFII